MSWRQIRSRPRREVSSEIVSYCRAHRSQLSLDLQKTSCICSWAMSAQQCSAARNPNFTRPFPSPIVQCLASQSFPLPQAGMPPIIFEDVVHTDNDRAVPVGQIPHLAGDVTSQCTPQSSRSKPVLERPCCFAKTCHACSSPIGCLHFEIQRY